MKCIYVLRKYSSLWYRSSYISYIYLISGDDDSILSPEAHYKIGAALAVLGNFIIAVSLNVQVRSFDFLCC